MKNNLVFEKTTQLLMQLITQLNMLLITLNRKNMLQAFFLILAKHLTQFAIVSFLLNFKIMVLEEIAWN